MSDFDRHTFWKDPAASSYPADVVAHCVPEHYLDLENVTRLVVETMLKYGRKKDSILEIGAGTGRNLAGLWKAGFRKLHGIEINQDAWNLGNKTFPELKNALCLIAPVETVIENFPEVDVIFTQGCLMHLPSDQEWVISTLAQKARRLIFTIEGERPPSFHAWLHDYRGIIEGTDAWRQVEEHSCEAWPPLPPTTRLRVFSRI